MNKIKIFISDARPVYDFRSKEIKEAGQAAEIKIKNYKANWKDKFKSFVAFKK